MPGVGVIQFGFALPRPWLPRELALLGAAATRCREAVQYRRMEASQREAEESERRRIGRELHDETGQSLLLLRLELEMLEREAPEPLRWRLRGARGIAEKTVEDVRRIVAALSPAMLERLGLPAALRQLAARFHRTCRTSVRIRLSNGFPLSAEAQQTIYRIAQESLQNAAKHSHATLVNLSLIETDKHVRLTVRDNGAGFRASIPDPRNISFGLTGMRERAEGCGGNLTVRSAPGMGTKVTLRLPTKTVRAVQHGVQHGKDTRTSHG